MTELAEHHKTYVREIRADNLSLNAKYQRKVHPGWIKDLCDNMDLDALDTIAVSKRDDGSYVVINGQHRVLALLKMDMGEWKMKCNVFEGLTEAQEAELFRTLNKNRRVTAYDDYNAGLVAGDEECLGIKRVTERYGCEIDRQCGAHKVACVSTVRKVWRNANGRPPEDVLGDTYKTVLGAWGAFAEALEAPIIGGVGMVMSRNETPPPEGLAKKLSAITPPALVANAKTMRDIHGGTIRKNVAHIAVGMYNKGRRKNTVPPVEV